MSRQGDFTVRSKAAPFIVIVSPAPEVLDAWLELLQRLDEVPRIQVTTIKETATAVARWRPFALLIEQEIFEFDSKEFTALARDVGAQVIAVSSTASKETMAAQVLPRVRELLTAWHSRAHPKR
jgi:dihydropteroate synthase